MKKLLLFIFLIIPLGLISQEINIGAKETIYSNVLNEDREFWVHLPRNYEQTQQSYGVLYLLDGNAHFNHVAGIMDFLTINQKMPPMILVAILNTERTRDLTPVRTDDPEGTPTGGGAENFLQFLKNELMPHVNKEYPTTGFDLLNGHSFGGLFAQYVLISHPQVFDAFISISPSMWWDNQSYVDKTINAFDQNKNLSSFYYMTLANEGGMMEEAVKKLDSIHTGTKLENFHSAFIHHPNETHNSVHHRSTYDGLEFIFEGWRLPSNWTDLGLDGLKNHYKKANKTYKTADMVPEPVINRLGYHYLRQDDFKQAIKTFKYNVSLYPGSANVYDSLGEALEKSGKTREAYDNYYQAFKIATSAKHPNIGFYMNNYLRLKDTLDLN